MITLSASICRFASELSAPTFFHDSSCIRACILRVFPYLRKKVVDVNKSDLLFSMHFDETTTAQVKKQMDLTLCYWSPTHNKECSSSTMRTTFLWTNLSNL